MENVFSTIMELFNEKKRVPKNLEECRIIDPTSAALNRWASTASLGGLVIALLIFLIGAYVGSKAEEFLAFLPYGIFGLIVLAFSEFVANLIRGLARIVYHTGITANIALMNANQNEDTETETPEKAVRHNVSHNSDFGTIPARTEMSQPGSSAHVKQPSKEVSKLLDDLY